ncbi:hypothetical protein BT63DRAFT_210313 [Microthyrium microscopicum]|uniref:RING-type domain-containing protein n=1 Tax=Microthyrium microscopicum TaxID=703497 RepID=A0A6A6UIC6_9PEZI|nr:hypothetical protein BT63DRAFT_210313 [Microthyrium microscopicum]
MDSLLALRGPPQPRDSDRTKHRSSRNSRHKEGHARRRQRSPSSSSPPIRRQHSRSPSPIRPRKHIRSTTNHRDGHKRHRRRGRSSHDARGVREADIEEEQDVGKRRHRRGRSISPIRSTRIAHPSLSGFPWNHDAASRHQLPRRTRKGLATTALVAGVFLFCLLSSRRSRRSRPETRTPIYPTFPVRPRAPMVAEAGSRMGFEEEEPLSDTDSEDEDDEPGTDTDSTERSHPMWLIRSQPRGGSSQPAIMPIIPSNFTFHESDESEDEDVDFQPARGEGSDGPSKECVVCSTEKDAEEFLQGITAECDHEVTTCRECLGHWIRTSLESRTWYDVRCAECPQNISYEDMMRIAPYDILDT